MKNIIALVIVICALIANGCVFPGSHRSVSVPEKNEKAIQISEVKPGITGTGLEINSSLTSTAISSGEEWKKTLAEQLRKTLESQTNDCSLYIKPLGQVTTPLVVNSKKMRAASMIKVFIMAEAFRQAKQGRLNLNDEHILKKSEKVGGAGNLQFASEGTRKSIRELIELMIIDSDNTATNIVIDRISMHSVNLFISDMGYKDTLLQRKMMDFDSIRIGKENFTSVTDLGSFFERIYDGTCVGRDQDKEMITILLRQTDNNKIPAMLPDNVKVAHKTGELVGAIHDGGIVYGRQKPYVICVMNEDVQSPNNAFSLTASLSKIVFQSIDGG